jgi:hypothetical protein
MPRVAHFEVHASEPEKAIAFYEAVFGWKFQRWGGPQEYWLITTGPDSEPGINGGLVRRQGAIDGTAVLAYVCTCMVPSLEETIKAVETAGGQIVMPRMGIPGVGWLAYAKDNQGNIFGMMQSDPEAR